METFDYLVGDDISMAASFNSNPIKTDRFNKVGIHAVWATGSSPVGDFTLQITNDIGYRHADGTVSGLTNWTTVTDTTAAAGGAAGSQYWDLETAARWVRVVYTRTSGSSTVDIRAHGKQF